MITVEPEGEAAGEMATTTTATTSILQRFGDEESTLLDSHERLSFQLHLHQVLSRSASSQGRKSLSFHFSQPDPSPPPEPERRRTKLRFQKLLNRLLKPIFPGRKPTTEVDMIGLDRKDTPPTFENKLGKWKAFSRSSRL